MTRPEDLKKIARQSFEAVETNNQSLLDTITDQKKFKLHFPGIPDTLNYQDAKKVNEEYYKGFPDAKATIEQQFVDGDYVITRVVFSGTHKGEFQGISPSNTKINASGISIQKIENGKIVEEWDEFDGLGMMQQIGAIPELAHSH
jgi:predicted ester cyclase